MFAFLRKVWGLARPYRARFQLGVLMGVIGGLFEPLMIGSVGFVYGLLFPTEAGKAMNVPSWVPQALQSWATSAQQAVSGGLKTHRGAVVAVVALIPCIILLRGLFTYLNVYLLQWVAVRTITDLRVRLFRHLMSLSAGFFSRVRTGELISRSMGDTSALQTIISNATPIMVKDPVVLTSLLVYLLWRHPTLTLISMVVMPACMAPVLIYSRKARRSARELQTQSAELGNVMVESFSGYRVVKAYNLEEAVTERFRAISRSFISHYMRIVRSLQIPGPLLEFVGGVGVALVLAYLFVQTGNRPSGADFLTVVLSIFAMYRPLKNLTRLYNTLEQARASSERVFELLATVNSVPEPAHPKPLRAAGSAIQFENVEFAYGEKPVLRGITLKIQPGQLVALVGPSGAGKTTMSNLLLRFYDPQRGSLRIGGVDIRDVSVTDLRSQIALVTQEIILFNESLRQNIALGRPGASQAEIETAAKHANAHHFISEMAQGYDTLAGERGVRLSGGQRQRLAIARAIIRNAPILILDEATSSLDNESERAVQAALDGLMCGRTTICIAHRLSTIQKADQIVVMNEGRIVETGTHAELIRHGGVYQRLYELQFESPHLSRAPALA
jgi:ATP-binding cassette, subfamily B, bacterial MsbA